jgi:hypothetical protein
MPDKLCRMCGQPLPAPPRRPGSDRFGCAVCGGELGAIAVEVTIKPLSDRTIRVVERVGSPDRRPTYEAKLGVELHRDSGREQLVERHVHHATDRYDEVIRDLETGEIVHERHQPLSEHRGYGAAKRKGGPT